MKSLGRRYGENYVEIIYISSESNIYKRQNQNKYKQNKYFTVKSKEVLTCISYLKNPQKTIYFYQRSMLFSRTIDMSSAYNCDNSISKLKLHWFLISNL